jgi:hypothetical protein
MENVSTLFPMRDAQRGNKIVGNLLIAIPEGLDSVASVFKIIIGLLATMNVVETYSLHLTQMSRL